MLSATHPSAAGRYKAGTVIPWYLRYKLVPQYKLVLSGRERKLLALPTLDMYLPLSKFESIQRVYIALRCHGNNNLLENTGVTQAASLSTWYCSEPEVRNLLLTKPITYHMDFITELHPLVEGHLMDARVQGEPE